MRSFALLLLPLALAGCQAPGEGVVGAGSRGTDLVQAHADLTAAIDELYRAFCFDAGGEADWEAIRAATASGASFFSPVAEGKPAKGVGLEEFIADFRDFIRSSPLGESGYHERVISTRVEQYGTIAQVLVTFEGFVPGEDADRRGVDSVQFVLSEGRWLLASFTTQYESAAKPIPARLLQPRR